MRVNKSDILAKGCEPTAALLNLTWPNNRTINELEIFARALSSELGGIPLIGGDTTKSKDALVLSLTMFAKPFGDGPILRSGAKKGDFVFVSGAIGNAAIGLDALINGKGDEFPNSIVHFQTPLLPPPALSKLIAKYATASLDVSDGLLGDAQKLGSASNVGIRLDLDSVPISKEGSYHVNLSENPFGELMRLLSFGDDYQALFSVDASKKIDLVNEAEAAKLGLTLIGVCTETLGLQLNYFGKSVAYDGSLSYTHNFQ